jgi:hypothetical protein
VSRLPFGSENIAARIATSPSPRRIAKAAARGAKWREQQAPYLHSFHPPAWTTPVTRLRCPIAKGATFWPARFGRAYRDAGRSLASLLSIPLPKSPADRLALIDALLEIQALHRNFVAEAGILANLMGGVLQGKEAAFRLIQEVAGTVADCGAGHIYCS